MDCKDLALESVSIILKRDPYHSGATILRAQIYLVITESFLPLENSRDEEKVLKFLPQILEMKLQDPQIFCDLGTLLKVFGNF